MYVKSRQRELFRSFSPISSLSGFWAGRFVLSPRVDHVESSTSNGPLTRPITQIFRLIIVFRVQTRSFTNLLESDKITQKKKKILPVYGGPVDADFCFACDGDVLSIVFIFQWYFNLIIKWDYSILFSSSVVCTLKVRHITFLKQIVEIDFKSRTWQLYIIFWGYLLSSYK